MDSMHSSGGVLSGQAFAKTHLFKLFALICWLGCTAQTCVEPGPFQSPVGLEYGQSAQSDSEMPQAGPAPTQLPVTEPSPSTVSPETSAEPIADSTSPDQGDHVDQADPPTSDLMSPPGTDEAEELPIIQPAGPVPQTQLKPIARWSTVPYQRVNQGETLNIGVVAFSKYGVARVRFLISGAGYAGPASIDVEQMTLNQQTGIYEYWTPVSASAFTGDGTATIVAQVFGHDGGYRDQNTDGGGVGLDTLPLVVNATGGRPQIRAWVSKNGSDGAGVVNSSTAPFGTIGRAIDAIRAYRSSQGWGYNGDGGVVHIMPGSYTCSTGGVGDAVTCDSEWLTLTTAEGGSADNTILTAGGSIVPTRKLRLKGLTLKGSGTLSMNSSEVTRTTLWVDGCKVIGSGRGVSFAHPLSYEYARTYYTDSLITEVQQATTGATLCRGLTITRISDDAFQNVPFVSNCYVDDIDPLNSGAHADAWQHAMGNSDNRRDDNVIVYNLTATRLKYQSIFIRADINRQPSMAQGMAFVNVHMEMLPNAYGWGGWARWVDHLLWWHCTFAGKGIGFMNDTYAGVKHKCRITNLSVKGCDFAFLSDVGSEIDWNSFESNHYVNTSFTPGSDVTTGNNGLGADGVPLSWSPLLNRMDPIVPADVNNRVRMPLATVGASQ